MWSDWGVGAVRVTMSQCDRPTTKFIHQLSCCLTSEISHTASGVTNWEIANRMAGISRHGNESINLFRLHWKLMFSP